MFNQQSMGSQQSRGRTSVLEMYGVLMNGEVDNYDNLVGREREINQIISTLYQRKKPNPVLLGKAGVGKTQIVEGLVKKIENGEVLGKLADASVYQFDVKLFAKGLMMQGQGLVNMLIEEIKESESVGNPVIIFLDELHLLVGQFSQTNTSAENPADVLKPALARGDLRIIGATTEEEFRSVEADKALERRLSPLYVDELSLEDTLEVLEGVRHYYEEFHGVEYGEDVFNTSIDLASRYLPDRAFPDKALDIIDKVGAKIASLEDQEGLTHEEEVLHYESIVALLNMSRNLINNNQEAVEIHKREFEDIIETQEELSEQGEDEKRVITKLDVRNYIKESQDLETLVEDYTEDEIVDELKKRLVGQDDAVKAVGEHMILSNYGFKDKTKPKLAMLFWGATGTGKTEMAKQISRIMYGTEDLIVLDGAEFQEKHSVAKIIGSPAGYVGYGNPTPFDTLRRRPNQVVLVDEFDKMHPSVKQVFLGIIEEGRVTVGSGNAILFNEATVIFTTNEKPQDEEFGRDTSGQIGFGKVVQEESLDESNLYFEDRPMFAGMSPELVNRFDEVIKFNEMTKEMVEKIFDIKYRDFQTEAYDEHNWSVNITPEAREVLVNASFNPEFGARPVDRTINRMKAEVIRHHGRQIASNQKELGAQVEYNITVEDDKINII